MTPRLYTASAVTISSSAYTSIQVGALALHAESRADIVRAGDRCLLGRLELEVSNTTAGASYTMYLTHDSAGLEMITDASSSGATRTITLGDGSASAGGVVWSLELLPLVVRSGLYVWVKASTGSPSVQPRLYVVGE